MGDRLRDRCGRGDGSSLDLGCLRNGSGDRDAYVERWAGRLGDRHCLSGQRLRGILVLVSVRTAQHEDPDERNSQDNQASDCKIDQLTSLAQPLATALWHLDLVEGLNGPSLLVTHVAHVVVDEVRVDWVERLPSFALICWWKRHAHLLGRAFLDVRHGKRGLARGHVVDLRARGVGDVRFVACGFARLCNPVAVVSVCVEELDGR